MKSLEHLTDSVFYIMAALTEPRHGYAVMSLIEEKTRGTFIVGPASLYTIIKKLIAEQLIQIHNDTDSRRKVYILTRKGRDILLQDIERRKGMIYMAEQGLQRGHI